jgi:tetratricopeptide (TPR) repeat protein
MKTFVVLLGLAALLEGQTVSNASEPDPVKLNDLGLQAYYQVRYPEAESLYRQALKAYDSLESPKAADRAITVNNLATLLRAEARYPEAEALLVDRLQQAEAATGPDSLEAGHAAAGLAALYWAWEDVPKAESFALRADAIFDRQLTGRATGRINNWNFLASVYIAEARYREAEELLRKILDGADDRVAAGAYNELSVLALRRREFSTAESLARTGLEIASRVTSSQHPMRAVALNNLAQICRFQGRYREAEQYYREAIAIWSDSLGPQHPDVAKAYSNLAALCHQRGREVAAEDLYRRAAASLESAYGKNNPLVLVVRNELADVWRAEGRLTESDKLGSATLALLEQTLPPQDPRVVRALENRARVLDSTRRGPEAAALRNQIQSMSLGLRNTQ